MTIDLVRRLYRYWLNVNRNGGAPTPAEENVLFETAQLNVLNRSVKLKGIETYQIIHDELSKIKPPKATIDISSGVFDKPSDMLYSLGIESVHVDGAATNYYDIEIMRSKEFNKRKNSLIVMPETEHPIAEVFDTNWVVRPETVSKIRCTYLKKPATPVWGYTSPSGTPIFDSNTSVDFELPYSMYPEIALDVLRQVGVSLRREDIVSIAHKLKEDE